MGNHRTSIWISRSLPPKNLLFLWTTGRTPAFHWAFMSLSMLLHHMGNKHIEAPQHKGILWVAFISPWLFNIFLDGVVREVRCNISLKLGLFEGVKIHIILIHNKYHKLLLVCWLVYCCLLIWELIFVITGTYFWNFLILLCTILTRYNYTLYSEVMYRTSN